MSKTALIQAALGLFLSCAAMPSLALAKKPKLASGGAVVRRCDRFSQTTDADNKTIVFRLQNVCDTAIRCTIGWKVSCGEERPEEQSVMLPGKSDQTFEASARACGNAAWSISPAEWTCHLASSDTASR